MRARRHRGESSHPSRGLALVRMLQGRTAGPAGRPRRRQALVSCSVPVDAPIERNRGGARGLERSSLTVSVREGMLDFDRGEEAGLLALHLVLAPAPVADAEQIGRSGRQLRAELWDLDVNDASPVDDGVPPPGAKDVGAAFLTEWFVMMRVTGGLRDTVVATVKDWLARRAGVRTIKLTFDRDTLEVGSGPSDERADQIEALTRRHQRA